MYVSPVRRAIGCLILVFYLDRIFCVSDNLLIAVGVDKKNYNNRQSFINKPKVLHVPYFNILVAIFNGINKGFYCTNDNSIATIQNDEIPYNLMKRKRDITL